MDIRIENLSYFCFRKIRRSLRMIMGMKKLLSLPPNLVDCFHAYPDEGHRAQRA